MGEVLGAYQLSLSCLHKLKKALAGTNFSTTTAAFFRSHDFRYSEPLSHESTLSRPHSLILGWKDINLFPHDCSLELASDVYLWNRLSFLLPSLPVFVPTYLSTYLTLYLPTHIYGSVPICALYLVMNHRESQPFEQGLP